MIITPFGLFFKIPNALTLLTLMLGVVLIGTQVRLEEEHLSRLHPKAYADYRKRVRRWI
jgi:protein-S-isoprenylcysteine O-methyltransferase Ste14